MIPAIIGAVASALSNNKEQQPQQSYNFGNAAESKPVENKPVATEEAASDKKLKDSEKTGKDSGSDWSTKMSNVMNGISTVMGAIPKGGSNQPVSEINYGSPAVSDERLKNKESLAKLFGDDGAIDAFSKIDAYVYNYTPKAQEMYQNGNRGVDDNPHFGPMAQDLAKNPVTSGTVHKDENGYMMVDTRQLTLTNTAMISQLARKIEELEERIGGR